MAYFVNQSIKSRVCIVLCNYNDNHNIINYYEEAWSWWLSRQRIPVSGCCPPPHSLPAHIECLLCPHQCQPVACGVCHPAPCSLLICSSSAHLCSWQPTWDDSQAPLDGLTGLTKDALHPRDPPGSPDGRSMWISWSKGLCPFLLNYTGIDHCDQAVSRCFWVSFFWRGCEKLGLHFGSIFAVMASCHELVLRQLQNHVRITVHISPTLHYLH